jgi:hypothetical protein
MTVIVSIAEYKSKKEIQYDQRELEMFWDIFKETKETISYLPKFMVIKLLSVCRERISE